MGNCVCWEGKQDDPPYERASRSVSADNEGSDYTQKEVDSLILETLSVIRTKLDIEEDPPDSLIKLNTVAEREEGWVQLVKAFIHVIPLDEPLGPAVVSLFLEDCPLPTRETAMKCVHFVDSLENNAVKEHRNLMIVLGCLAAKLAGPSSVSLLTDQILDHMIRNLEIDKPPSIILFSLISLEKFAHTSENKSKIRNKLSVIPYNEHPLIKLEKYINHTDDFLLGQIGFCAQWCLDNLLPVEGRKFTYTCINIQHINFMLNYNDASEYLKLSPDGLSARCDSSSFESVRGTGQADQGSWFYEVVLLTGGVMQIGWATKKSKFLNTDGYGIGDDEYSQAYDGCRQLMWYNASTTDVSHNLPCWKPGDVVGLFLNISEKLVKFYLNGQQLGPFHELFKHASYGFFPAASFMAFQQCEFNFGAKPFKYPPKEDFKNFNEECELSSEDKTIWPRPVKLKRLERMSVDEDTCIICYDLKATASLSPCQHSGFCENCACELMKRETCPICRSRIVGYLGMEAAAGHHAGDSVQTVSSPTDDLAGAATVAEVHTGDWMTGEVGDGGDLASAEQGDPASAGHRGDPASAGHRGDPASAGHREYPASAGHRGDPASTEPQGDPASAGHRGDPAFTGTQQVNTTRREGGTTSGVTGNLPGESYEMDEIEEMTPLINDTSVAASEDELSCTVVSYIDTS